ncbi:MAG TPA: GGDEF domain-containing protein [Steroidobacteraceae bacterium]|nr:GGDEF domain-containing protein [Steroidobacteraceae bacterium]
MRHLTCDIERVHDDSIHTYSPCCCEPSKASRWLAPLVESPNGRTHAMLIIDIDHFKSINDQHGHPEGDEALKLVAALLRAQVHDPAFIGRLGGEGFVVVAPDSNAQTGRQLAEQFRESVMTIDTRRWLADRCLTVSIGLTVSRPSGDTPSHML